MTNTPAYTICDCCQQRLRVDVQETIPGRPRTIVTCTNDNCHKDVKWQTKSVQEHRDLCAQATAAR